MPDGNAKHGLSQLETCLTEVRKMVYRKRKS